MAVEMCDAIAVPSTAFSASRSFFSWASASGWS
jgi:hypothetical protein